MDQTLWAGRCDPQAPLLVIGAGRSGSSLLARILGSHPDICFDDENGFLLPKLWHLVWEKRRPRPIGVGPDSRLHITDNAERNLKDRLAPLLAQAFVSILGIDPNCGHWGYKEVWNGSASHRY